MLFIKSFGFFRNRVHQDRAYTNQRCGIDYTQDRIVEEIGGMRRRCGGWGGGWQWCGSARCGRTRLRGV